MTRFPPSPTGYFHIGSARTALFNYLFAKHHGGTMGLRFEDTDKTRSKPEFEEDIVGGLRWLAIEYEMGTGRQSERQSVYQPYVQKLIDSGNAYEAEASEHDADKKVVRFKNPNIVVTFKDMIRGDISFDMTELKDFVIAKSINEPLYHLAVVVDDHEMGVTHVIRGEDHIPNTPRQILLLEALGFTRPEYAHIPLILDQNRAKLSKRNFAASVNDYKTLGYSPKALVNYLALLGWTPPSGKEKLSIEEMAVEFDIRDVHTSGAIFDLEKLKWLNRQYMIEIPEQEFLDGVMKYAQHWDREMTTRLIPLLRERINVWKEFDPSEFDYFFNTPKLEVVHIPEKNSDAHTATRHLEYIQNTLDKLSLKNFETAESIKQTLFEYATKEGRGAVLWPLRYALSGKLKSPDPFTLIRFLGKEETLSRIQTAMQHIAS